MLFETNEETQPITLVTVMFSMKMTYIKREDFLYKITADEYCFPCLYRITRGPVERV